MKVIVLSPWKVFLAGVISCLLIVASVLGALALWGVFSSDTAQAVEAAAAGEKIWYFAEGYTGPGFEEWILIYNPPSDQGGTGEPVKIDMKFYGPNGYIGFYAPSVMPGQRLSVNVNQVMLDMFGYSGDVSIVVRSLSPFICERALYFNYKGQWTGGSQSSGYSTSSI
jgi:hypothetical protein